MVEIPPHVGIVQELGIRMTKIRNYFGQKVVIPNRNIATVANYMRGAQQVNIDVAARSDDTAKQMKSCIVQIIDEIGSQFEEVIISTQKTAEIISLSTGECFVRVSLAIWPQQQWVIEQEIVPRIRLILKSKAFDILNDKVSVFYHTREQQPIGTYKRSKNENHFIQLKRRKQTGSDD